MSERTKIEQVPLQAISAAALPDGDGVEIVVIPRQGGSSAFLIGPVAAKTLILLLREAVEAIEGGP